MDNLLLDFSLVKMFVYMVKRVVQILESGSILEILLLLSVGEKNVWLFLYLFQKIQSIFFPPCDL